VCGCRLHDAQDGEPNAYDNGEDIQCDQFNVRHFPVPLRLITLSLSSSVINLRGTKEVVKRVFRRKLRFGDKNHARLSRAKSVTHFFLREVAHVCEALFPNVGGFLAVAIVGVG